MSTAPYKTLRQEAADEVIINKSRFIGYACPCETEEEALAFLNKIRTKHKDATHNCYAYVIGRNAGIMRYSDDGEPGGTAGLPMMEVLKAQGVVNCCVVVTRYFGGILLGAGGLVRAYTQAAKMAVEAGGIVLRAKLSMLSVTCTYADYQKITPYLSAEQLRIDDTAFGADVTVCVAMPVENKEEFFRCITEVTNGRALLLEKGERFDYL